MGVNRRVLQWVGVLLGACVLTACVVPRSADNPVHTFVLAVDESVPGTNPRTGPPGVHGVLVVGVPQAEAGFEQARMAYLQRPYEVSYYATNVWADTPARMMAPVLLQSLERTNLWRVVVPMPTAVRGDYRLDISGLMLQQEFLQRPSGTRVRLRAQLTETKEQRIMGARSLESFEPAPSEDAYGGVLAANRAVTRVLESLNDWLSSCLQGAGKESC